MDTSEVSMIMGGLKAIKRELVYSKTHMVDIDSISTPDEAESIEAGLAEYKAGKAKTIEEFEAELVKRPPELSNFLDDQVV